MKDLIIPVNNEALSRAMVSVVGEQNAQIIQEAYKVIDASMVFGYHKAQAEAEAEIKRQAEEYVCDLQRRDDLRQDHADDAFERGSIYGAQERYDDGYVDGVHDARAFPTFADDQVALLCADDEFYDEGHEYDYEAYYEGDSGDENYPSTKHSNTF